MKYLLSILLLLTITELLGQDSLKNRKFEFRGYIKNLQTLTFDKDMSELSSGNLIHNRLNFKYKPLKWFTAAIEMRNRLFWGEEVKNDPDFSSRLEYASESFDLSYTWFENEAMLFHTNIDRFWMEYASKKWVARLGRQRINWGVGNTWNPNDVFNTFNFLDFDYEERPACDAAKLQYNISAMSSMEFAASRTGITGKRVIVATRYYTNFRNYDFQFIGGWFLDQPTVGVGWSGSLGNAGFKGEAQYFFKRDTIRSQLNVVLEGDYVFEKGWYVSAGALLNNRGWDQPIKYWNATQLELSPRNLMPTKWNVIATVAKEITPIFSANASFIYSPQTNMLIVIPSIQYNISTNVDINFIWQSFFAEQQEGFDSLSHRAYLRLKCSF